MNLDNTDPTLDQLIAKLNLLTTDFIFSQHQCVHKTIAIAQQLQKICQHQELLFFPEQQKIYYKMLKVWKALAYENSSTKSKQHSRQDNRRISQAIH